MSSITIPTVPTTVPSSTVPSTGIRLAVPARAGAIGGLAFAASILAQNVLRASAPANDASPDRDHPLLQRPPAGGARPRGALPDRCRRPLGVRRHHRLAGERSGSHASRRGAAWVPPR